MSKPDLGRGLTAALCAMVLCAMTLFAALAASTAATAQEPLSPVRLNQLGFLPSAAKRASVPTDAEAPLPWRLVDAAGAVRATGQTAVFGVDAASGDVVHIADFSAASEPCEGCRLVVGEAESRPFTIAPGLYAPLARDALAYFYHNRAGVPIEARLVGERWARPAGHAPDVATCFDKADTRGRVWSGCGYSLDVSEGWYDAGDQGKYVVNGGIAAWTLLNAHERDPAAFPDGAAAIPEAGNGVSDLLDEARWEVEMLLAMQVPDGARLEAPAADGEVRVIDAGGMAHHKLADAEWTPLPTAPQEDRETRYLYPPSTAATLNLAAVAAQCARIWRTIDAAFSARCLSAAETAYAAARRNPQVPASNAFTGSGGYLDRDVSDEFYWAAAELFATTRASTYAEDMRASPRFLAAPAGDAEGRGDIAWQSTSALGTISLVLTHALPEAEDARARASLAAAADGYLRLAAGQGYGVPYAAEAYPWGSNSSVLNDALVLGTAYDLTGERRYRDGVVAAMDYVLGRNPLDRSYVSGYGARPMTKPHHRFWAESRDPAYPPPPPGALSGGPNSADMADPVARKMDGACRPQTCWADDPDAYALNEVAINWNAPLVWAAAFLAGDE